MSDEHDDGEQAPGAVGGWTTYGSLDEREARQHANEGRWDASIAFGLLHIAGMLHQVRRELFQLNFTLEQHFSPDEPEDTEEGGEDDRAD